MERSEFLPYCLPSIGEEEVNEVVDSLRGGWLTTGPKVQRFEEDFARYVGARHAVAVNSCTAALHLALVALDIGPGDEVIVPTMTFCSTANVVVHTGATPVLVDVNEHLQIDPVEVAKALTPRTRAIFPVHYGGMPCDLDEIARLARQHGIPVIEDAAHAVGSSYNGRMIGTHSLATAFSFYATKNMTTGEGGMITTNDAGFAERIRRLSLHGMNRDAWKRYGETGSWYYEVTEAGFKYNMTDIQAAIGIHQLRRLESFNARRREIAARYQEAFSGFPELRLPEMVPGCTHCYHLYPVQLLREATNLDREAFIAGLKKARIGTSVHFVPVHRHPYYSQRFGYTPAMFPVAERRYHGLVSLPLYPGMSDDDVQDVIGAVCQVLRTARLETDSLAVPSLTLSATAR
jgi:dTDP-4-amino-4,6-dideoxygalactose transaminase